jgi:twitching motility protein PilI
VLVVRLASGAVGLVVDEVLGQRSFLDEQLRGVHVYADSPVSRFLENEYQVGQTSWGIVNVDALMHATEFLQAAA